MIKCVGECVSVLRGDVRVCVGRGEMSDRVCVRVCVCVCVCVCVLGGGGE